MTLRRAKSFQKYREGLVCDECGRPYSKKVAREWYADYKRHIAEHNEWHRTATDQEIAEHEREEKFEREMAASVMSMMLGTLRPATSKPVRFEWREKEL